MSSYPNWFAQVGADRNFARHLIPLSEALDSMLVCQIGAFTGDASVWMLDHLPNVHVYDVDTWGGSPEEAQHERFDWADVERTYDAKVTDRHARAVKRKMTSDDWWRSTSLLFDFIYIDGNHQAPQVARDGLAAMEHLRPGGIIAFDDYTWGLGLPIRERPRAAVDFVLGLYADRLDVIEVGLQAWARLR